jgi:hypothetical protein
MSREGCYGVFFASHQIAATQNVGHVLEQASALSPE